MMSLLERIKENKTLLADGAMGTMLFQKGLEQGTASESINLTRPKILEEIAVAYKEAGSDILLTNTFGGSPLKLKMAGLDDQTEEINKAAIEAVRRACGDTSYIAASVGPSGKMLKPYGDVEPEVMKENFKRQISALAHAKVDAICIETMTDIHEAIIAVKAAKEIAGDIPIICTMTFDAKKKGFKTIMGVSIEQACKELVDAGADIIGSNCGNGIENMLKIATEFKQHSEVQLIFQANAGLPETVAGKLVYKETPEMMAQAAKKIVDLGVAIIGGCCGTSPDHIKAFRHMLDNY